MNQKLKNVFRWLHLWLGLITSPVVCFICLTGTIVVFADEIMELSAGDARFVQEVKAEKVPVEQLLENLKGAYPNRMSPFYMVAYKDPVRSVRFNSYGPKDGLNMVYVDPYTGEILKSDKTIYFFFIVAHLHHCLLMHDIGKWIVDISTLIFVLVLLSGLVIWFPKKWSKKHKKASFTIKWNAPWRRRNYDLHKVLGFYSLAFVLLLSLTGLILGFESWTNVTLNIFGGNSEVNWQNDMGKWDKNKKAYPINDAIAYAFNKHPDKKEVQVNTYFKDAKNHYLKASDMAALKSVVGMEFLAIDKVSGAEVVISEDNHKNEKIKNWIWRLHMGTWLGLFGKIVTFIGGLIATSLPVTGFIIWNQKRKKVN